MISLKKKKQHLEDRVISRSKLCSEYDDKKVFRLIIMERSSYQCYFYTLLVRSRVLLSVVDDLDSEEFMEYGPTNSLFDPVDQLLPSVPATKHLTPANETNQFVSMEAVARESRKNESQLVASAA